jgi:hypothetical protein
MSRRLKQPEDSSDSDSGSSSTEDDPASSDEEFVPVLGVGSDSEDSTTTDESPEVQSEHDDDEEEFGSDDEPPQLHLPPGMVKSRDGTIWDSNAPAQSRRRVHNIANIHPGPKGVPTAISPKSTHSARDISGSR